MRRLCWSFLIVGVFLGLMASPVTAKVKPRVLASANQVACAVAIDPSGNPHVAYQGTDYHLYHARFDGHSWQHELVDGTSDCGWGNSIAIDAQGHIHISYGAFRGLGAQKLVYAQWNGAQWQITDVGVDGTDTTLKLDSANHPHILYAGSTLGYAVFDGMTWQTEDTGLPYSPYRASLALDSDDHAHVAYTVNFSGHFYATNESGIWEVTTLGNETGQSAVVVDSSGVPHVASAIGNALLYHSLAETNWTTETVISSNDTQNVILDGVAVALDAQNRAHFMVSASVMGAVEVAVYAYDDGVGWNGILVDKKNAGYYPSIAVDTNGVVSATYCTVLKGNSAMAKYVRIALPDLSGAWSNVTVTNNGGVNTVTGTLTVQNHGLDKSVKTTAALWLSTDAILDAGDELLPAAVKVKSLAPGATVAINVQFQYTGSLSGKNLIAVIDPDVLTSDRNLLDNIVPVALGP